MKKIIFWLDEDVELNSEKLESGLISENFTLV